MVKLDAYHRKRNFERTGEPQGEAIESEEGLRFVVQHHMARRDHYDLRLEWDGALLSWAVPKGPSFDPRDKRLAVQVEEHPLEYRNFEGTIPQGEYGGGTVMLWDEGRWEPYGDAEAGLREGTLKFALKGRRLKGKWALIRLKAKEGEKKDNWLLLKERDEYAKAADGIFEFTTSVRTGRTMAEIEAGADEKIVRNPFSAANVQLAKLVNAIPEGGDWLYEDYFYIDSVSGLIYEAQMDTLEFHTWGSRVDDLEKPDVMVFDLDPDEGMDLDTVRRGVKDLQGILSELSLNAYLKTSGGKGYHVVVPITPVASWDVFHDFARRVAEVMEQKWPDRYTSNVRKNKRTNKIFIDWIRNGRGATSIAPYSIRARKGARVSMPIAWDELDTVAPDGVTMADALLRIRRSDPWEDFFRNHQSLK